MFCDMGQKYSIATYRSPRVIYFRLRRRVLDEELDPVAMQSGPSDSDHDGDN